MKDEKKHCILIFRYLKKQNITSENIYLMPFPFKDELWDRVV